MTDMSVIFFFYKKRPLFKLFLPNISRFLEQYLSRSITTYETHLQYIRQGHDTRETKRKETKERLKHLSTKLETFFKEQREALEDDVDKHVSSLKEFLHKKTSMDEVCR